MYLFLAVQAKCQRYWCEAIGDTYETPDKTISVTTTSIMPFADFVIRTFSVKNVSHHSLMWGQPFPALSASLLMCVECCGFSTHISLIPIPPHQFHSKWLWFVGEFLCNEL